MEENRTAVAEATTRDRISPVYRLVTSAVWPVVRWWGRIEVTGAECLPEHGPAIVLANHDSAWDPVVIAAAVRRRRQIHALAKVSLWKHPMLARVLDGMGQIPVDRGGADTAAMATAARHLAAGGCVGIFPEGTVSRGPYLRAHSGAGRLVLAAPRARCLRRRHRNR